MLFRGQIRQFNKIDIALSIWTFLKKLLDQLTKLHGSAEFVLSACAVWKAAFKKKSHTEMPLNAYFFCTFTEHCVGWNIAHCRQERCRNSGMYHWLPLQKHVSVNRLVMMSQIYTSIVCKCLNFHPRSIYRLVNAFMCRMVLHPDYTGGCYNSQNWEVPLDCFKLTSVWAKWGFVSVLNGGTCNFLLCTT